MVNRIIWDNYKQTKKGYMSAKIRMNTEYRNKFYNRIKDVFEKEETQEQQAFLQARENFDVAQKTTFEFSKASC